MSSTSVTGPTSGPNGRPSAGFTSSDVARRPASRPERDTVALLDEVHGYDSSPVISAESVSTWWRHKSGDPESGFSAHPDRLVRDRESLKKVCCEQPSFPSQAAACLVFVHAFLRQYPDCHAKREHGQQVHPYNQPETGRFFLR